MSAYKMPRVSCAYGAPMGRRAIGLPNGRVRLVRVYLDSGGYDNGGAYWGIGKPLYMATNLPLNDGDSEYTDFVRANSRREAAELMQCADYLVRGV